MSLDDPDEDNARTVLDGLDLPIDWRIRLAGYTPRLKTIGESGAVVIRLAAADRPPLFLKADSGPFAETPAEAARLEWMAAQHLPAPRVVDHVAQHGTHILLMTTIPGRDLASDPGLSPDSIARLIGEVLASLHARNPATCPFDHRIDNRLPLAERNLAAGRVQPSWGARQSPDEAWATLLATRPTGEDLVVTHGDACLPNFLVEGGRFTGYVDCGRLGLADRWQDLALALRSLERNCGPGHAGTLLSAYGLAEADEPRRSWYQLLDEFF